MDVAKRNAELAEYYPLIRYVIRTRLPHVVSKQASPAAYRHQRGMDFEDLFQEGVIALMRAYDKFDPTRGVKFSTVAYQYIFRACSAYAVVNSTVIKIPVNAYQIQKHGTEFSKARLSSALNYHLFTDLPTSLFLDGGEPLNSTPLGDHDECKDPALRATDKDHQEYCLTLLRSALPSSDYGLLLSRMNGMSYRALGTAMGRSAAHAQKKFEALAYKCHHILFQEIEDEK